MNNDCMYLAAVYLDYNDPDSEPDKILRLTDDVEGLTPDILANPGVLRVSGNNVPYLFSQDESLICNKNYTSKSKVLASGLIKRANAS